MLTFQVLKVRGIVLFAFVLWVMAGCTQQPNTNNKPRSIGNTSEVLVVMQNQEMWDGPIGQTIQQTLGQEQYGLPQVEPLFKISHIAESSFSALFKKHRNILLIDIAAKYENPSMEVFKDLWASPQCVFRVRAASISQFVKLFTERNSSVIECFGETERSRIMQVFETSSVNKASEAVMEYFGFSMDIPSGYFLAKSSAGFMWVRKEVSEYSQGIIIFSEPYKDQAQFSPASILARTNRILRANIPGDSDGTFMQIDTAYIVPVYKQITDFSYDYTIESRGTWWVAHDFMAGPYISYTFTDEDNTNIVTILGYVYYPNEHKRDLLRQIEAIIYSAKPVAKIKR